jgi:pyruvate dehydrogenase E2 component (dihydrolipoamide acetyltransferase)
MYDITMPKLSDSMVEGRIIAWKVREGQPVHEGDVLAEVESDKATMELECFHNGALAKIVHGDNSEVKVGDVIGYIAPEGGAAVAPEKTPSKEPEQAAVPKAQPAPPIQKAARPETIAPAQATRVAISPFARKLARKKGADVTQLKGTGPGGRIVARDVEAAGAPAPRVVAPAGGEGARRQTLR